MKRIALHEGEPRGDVGIARSGERERRCFHVDACDLHGRQVARDACGKLAGATAEVQHLGRRLQCIAI